MQQLQKDATRTSVVVFENDFFWDLTCRNPGFVKALLSEQMNRCREEHMPVDDEVTEAIFEVKG